MSYQVIDTDYLFPRYAASYLLTEGSRAAFVETNTAHAVPRLLAQLKMSGMGPDQVEYIVVTHVHLDHAGGSSALMAACPNATLLAHPRAARHLKDPSRLVASAEQVYGKSRFEQLYGRIDPIDGKRIREMADGEVLKWGDREWLFFHTRGHANHHFCLWDSKLQAVFTGDSFGICYPDLGGKLIFPSTSPTDFDAEQARKSILQIASLPGEKALLTHFGEVRNLKQAAHSLLEWIDFSENLLNQASRSSESDEDLTAFCLKELEGKFRKHLQNLSIPEKLAWPLLRLDMDLNAAGLAHVAIQRRRLPANS